MKEIQLRFCLAVCIFGALGFWVKWQLILGFLKANHCSLTIDSQKLSESCALYEDCSNTTEENLQICGFLPLYARRSLC